MGTKLALRSAAFLDALIRRQVLLSAACACLMSVAAALITFADSTAVRLAGDAWRWAILAASAGGPLAVGVWYARRAADLEDEAFGMVDVATLPPSFTAPLGDDALRGD